jgi:hypothetical protein
MPHPPSAPADGVPRWLILVGSLAIAWHVTAVAFGALNAPSGPWGMEPQMSPPPQVVTTVTNVTTANYLKHLRMTHNYHFPSNRPARLEVEVQFRLKDADGNPLLKDADGKEIVLTLPEKDATGVAREMQTQLAQWLTGDEPVNLPQSGEPIMPEGKKPEKEQFWQMVKGQLEIQREDRHRLRDFLGDQMMLQKPSAWSQMMAESYARYLGRKYGAARVQVIRHHKMAVPPGIIFADQVGTTFYDEMMNKKTGSNFGEFHQ